MDIQFDRLAAVLLALFAGSCSIHQESIGEGFRSVDSVETLVLNSATTVKASGAKRVVLKPGTRWMLRGKIPQGEVYSTRDQVVMVESYNTREAFLVVNDSEVSGFYLPVEHAFVKTETVEIQWKKQGEETNE